MVLWNAPRSWTDREMVTGAILTQQIQRNLLASLLGITQAAGDLGVALGANDLARVALGIEGATFRMDDEGDAAAWWTPSAWTPIYGPIDADASHAIVKMYSGAIVRARRGTSGQIYVQKITDPTTLSQWTTWTEVLSGGVSINSFATAGIALGSSTTEDRLRLFYVLSSDGRTLKNLESTDGTTWSEETVVAEASPGFLVGIAADMTGGDAHVVYMFDAASGSTDQFLIAYEKVAGAWTNRTVKSGAFANNTQGIAAARDPATNVLYVVVAATVTAQGDTIQVYEFDRSTNTWTVAGTTLYTAPAGTTLWYPRLRHADGDYNRHAYSWTEETAGSVYSPVLKLADPPSRYLITESVSWGQIKTQFGLALLRTASHWYLSGARRAFRALLSLGPEEPLVEDFAYPWYAPIDPIDPATGHTNWNTRQSVNGPYTSLLESSGAQNAEVYWDVALAPGAWTLGLVFKKASDAGIITVTLDGASGTPSTVDGYNAATQLGQTTSVTFTVATTGVKRLKLALLTKNASSSSYKGYVHHLTLMRTA